ncbi:MAG: HDIG domain-containing protein [Lentisphaerae bacterium]|nr:HDIG domain-containing protein [Lentisphaerota bacterium]
MKLSKYLKDQDLMPASAAKPPAAPGAPAAKRPLPDGRMAGSPARNAERSTAGRGLSAMPHRAAAASVKSPSIGVAGNAWRHVDVPAPGEEESGFDANPAGIYEAARQMGIPISDNRNLVLENAKACLGTVFSKMLYEQGDSSQDEREMLWPMVKSIAMDIAHIVSDDHNILLYLQRHRVRKERLLWHSLYTAILAMDLARQMKGLDSSIQEIGGAALLHDVGLILHPEGVERLDMDNDPRYQSHVTEGVDMVRKIGAPEHVVRMIHDHHRRLDGLGFPAASEGEEFPMTSQIVAVSNVFEIMVIELSIETQTSKSGAAPANDMHGLLQQYRQAFDDGLLKAMISIVGFYPVGSVVELDNRVIGAVIRQNTDMPLRPIVKVIVDGQGNRPEQEKILDLQQNRLLSVVRTLAYPHESLSGRSGDPAKRGTSALEKPLHEKRSGGLT